MTEPLTPEEVASIRDRMDVWSDYGPDPTDTIERLLATLDAARADPAGQALALLNLRRDNPYSDGENPANDGKGERWAGWVEGFDAARGILDDAARLSHDRGADAVREALTPLRGYPEPGDIGLTRWRSDPNGAYIGFEDAVDALSVPAPTPPALDALTVGLDGIEGEVREVLEAQHGNPYRALEAISRRVVALREALRNAV